MLAKHLFEEPEAFNLLNITLYMPDQLAADMSRISILKIVGASSF